MKVEGWVMTNRVGSKCTFTVEIHDEDVADLNEQDRDAVIAEAVQESMWNHVEWGWKP